MVIRTRFRSFFVKKCLFRFLLFFNRIEYDMFTIGCDNMNEEIENLELETKKSKSDRSKFQNRSKNLYR